MRRGVVLSCLITVAVAVVIWLIVRRDDGSNAKSADASSDAVLFVAMPPAVPIDASIEAPHPSLAATDPAVLSNAEAQGLAIGALLNPRGSPAITTEQLYAASPAYKAIVDVLSRDLVELNGRPKIGEGPDFGNHPFRAKWLKGPTTRFELVGAINRLDRRTGEASRGCGELRLVYRLAADPTDRPTTRLPMTLNVLFPQAKCAPIAQRWSSLAAKGEERVRGLVAIFTDSSSKSAAPAFDQIEVNFQNVHGPSLREDMDDHAEYVLRAFDVDSHGATPRGLFNTPRAIADLDAAAQGRLADFVRDRFDTIDDGTWVVPNDLLAERIVSVTPRGLERPGNRVWSELLSSEAITPMLAALPYDRAKLVKSPAALVRRLEEGTCAGCHQTRAIAGFHLLGEERVRTAFNMLATAGSPHFHEDLRWRQLFVEAIAKAATAPARPFTSRPVGVGGYGSICGLDSAPTGAFASWTCDAPLACTSTGASDVGLCLPKTRGPGDACQTATVLPRKSADGDRVQVGPLESCKGAGKRDAGADMPCSPNGFGFPGGLCSTECETLGDEHTTDSSICVDIPSSGYESECFFVPVPIEKCIETHKARRRVRSCDAEHPCRPDFACVATTTDSSTAQQQHGACVPPYFVFQARVDGPMLDRP